MPAMTAPHKSTGHKPADASDAARNYAIKLLGLKSRDGLSPAMTVWAELLLAGQNIPARNCSDLLDRLKAASWLPKDKPAKSQLTEGVYFKDGRYIKAQKSKSGGGMYGKIWEDGHWSYAPGLLAGITAEMALTAEQAKAWGDATHHCIYCGLELTDDRSITAGYGPKCASNYGLPWGD